MQRNERAIERASSFEEDPRAVWINGSKSEGGVAAGAVATYRLEDSSRRSRQVLVKRDWMLGRGERRKSRGRPTRSSDDRTLRQEVPLGGQRHPLC